MRDNLHQPKQTTSELRAEDQQLQLYLQWMIAAPVQYTTLHGDDQA